MNGADHHLGLWWPWVMIVVVALWLYFRQKGGGEDETHQEGDVKEVVRLYLAPEAEEASLPYLGSHTAVHLRGHNVLPAYVNHRYCEIFVDCGTSSAIMKYSRAKQLGLLSQATGSKVVMVRMWSRKTTAKMLVVEAVPVELAGGVYFPCTFLVAPKHGPINSLYSDVILDNATLRRTQAILRFSSSFTTLFFPSPLPEWRPRTSRDSQFVLDNIFLDENVKGQELNVHVDSGARFFYASRRYHKPGTSVELVVAKNAVFQWYDLQEAPTTTFDFVVGVRPLSKYKCMLDFAGEHLYFCINGRVYRTPLRRTITL